MMHRKKRVGEESLGVAFFFIFYFVSPAALWRGVEHFVGVDGLSVSQATQLPDRHCRSVLKRRTASISAYAGSAAAVLIM